MTKQQQFESINNQLDLVNQLVTMTRDEIKSAFELLSPSMLGVIKNLCTLQIINIKEGVQA